MKIGYMSRDGQIKTPPFVMKIWVMNYAFLDKYILKIKLIVLRKIFWHFTSERLILFEIVFLCGNPSFYPQCLVSFICLHFKFSCSFLWLLSPTYYGFFWLKTALHVNIYAFMTSNCVGWYLSISFFFFFDGCSMSSYVKIIHFFSQIK